jgi:hypothetical protein
VDLVLFCYFLGFFRVLISALRNKRRLEVSSVVLYLC